MVISLVASSFQASHMKTEAQKEADCRVLLLRGSADQQTRMRNAVASVTKANVPNNKRLHFQSSSYTVPCFLEKKQKFQLCAIHPINTHSFPLPLYWALFTPI